MAAKDTQVPSLHIRYPIVVSRHQSKWTGFKQFLIDSLKLCFVLFYDRVFRVVKAFNFMFIVRCKQCACSCKLLPD